MTCHVEMEVPWEGRSGGQPCCGHGPWGEYEAGVSCGALGAPRDQGGLSTWHRPAQGRSEVIHRSQVGTFPQAKSPLCQLSSPFRAGF